MSGGSRAATVSPHRNLTRPTLFGTSAFAAAVRAVSTPFCYIKPSAFSTRLYGL
jgi:hypothetical protein